MRCLCLYPVKCPGVCPVHSPVSAPSAQTKESECRVCGGAVYCVLCTVYCVLCPGLTVKVVRSGRKSSLV